MAPALWPDPPKQPTIVGLLAASGQAAAQGPRPDQLALRALYRDLVETNTTLSTGDCTLAAGLR